MYKNNKYRFITKKMICDNCGSEMLVTDAREKLCWKCKEEIKKKLYINYLESKKYERYDTRTIDCYNKRDLVQEMIKWVQD